MELSAARRLGESLLAKHGLEGSMFGFDGARRRAGLCSYSVRRITVSRTLMAPYSPEQARETILHEVAHALAGPEHGHDAVWRAVAKRIGSTGTRLGPTTRRGRPPRGWADARPVTRWSGTVARRRRSAAGGARRGSVAGT